METSQQQNVNTKPIQYATRVCVVFYWLSGPSDSFIHITDACMCGRSLIWWWSFSVSWSNWRGIESVFHFITCLLRRSAGRVALYRFQRRSWALAV